MMSKMIVMRVKPWISDEQAPRPNKDDYYLNIAKAVSLRSTCLKRKYGCVIVKDDEIVSTGYNGSPRGEFNCVDNGYCTRSIYLGDIHGKGYEHCTSVHAEMNAIISAARKDLHYATAYLYGYDLGLRSAFNPEPCPLCDRLLRNAGIVRVVTWDL